MIRVDACFLKSEFRGQLHAVVGMGTMTNSQYQQHACSQTSTRVWGIHPTVPSNMVKCITVPNSQLDLFTKNTINAHYFLRTAHTHNLAYAFNDSMKLSKEERKVYRLLESEAGKT